MSDHPKQPREIPPQSVRPHRAWSIYICSVAGIPIFVHMTLLLLLAWLVGFELTNRRPALEGVLFAICIFGSVALHELGQFEDIVQAGQVRPAEAALWFSEAADVWDDNHHPFSAAKRSLYIAIRHAQIPLDFVVEGDDLASYKTLYLTDGHVSRKASQAIAAWVRAGGRLFARRGTALRRGGRPA